MKLTSNRLKIISAIMILLPALAGLAGCGTSGGDDLQPPEFHPLKVLEPEAPGKVTLGGPPLTLDISNLGEGYVVAIAEDDGKTKSIQLVSDTNITYSYFVQSGETAVLPLTDGEGKYMVTCYQQVEGSQYAALFWDNLDVHFDNPFYPYLYPNQYVDFNSDSEAVKLAHSLLPDDSTDVEGLDAIYDYVIENVVYDEDKAVTVEPGYLPDIDSTLASGTGICFDYAALMTAMLRSRDIPCRLVTGYSGTVKHAWIDVYIRSKGWVQQAISFDGEDWTRMDPTFASVSPDEEFINYYIGDGSNYAEQYAH